MARMLKNLNIVINEKHARILQAMADENKRSSTAQGAVLLEQALDAWLEKHELAVVYRV